MIEPGSAADVRFAARLVVEGVVPQDKVRALLAKQKELVERGKPLSIPEMAVRLSWLGAAEARWLLDPDAPPADLLPGLSLGPRIGVGGMSRVYRAVDLGTNVPVAVKVLLPQLRRSPEARERFRAEAELLCRLGHENLVQGFYFHEHEGLDYLVMELVEGGTALERLDAGGVFGEQEALRVIVQAARALEYLASQGFVHRDVKPGNLLLGAGGAVKVCDLGFTARQGADAGAETTCGTVQYLAPEQAAGDGCDARADIYALGVTLFQLTIGKLPFEAGDDEESLRRRMTDELRAKELKGFTVSQHLHYFIQKMTACDRGFRYQSPAELVADVEESLAGRSEAEPVRRPTPGAASARFKSTFAAASGAARRPLHRRAP
ncbi:MAG TPA: serine/threonine-protein kinase [Planctomycetota bacterium]|nr:serine/threonine-protein kinase [Planctomycetota bacterium]